MKSQKEELLETQEAKLLAGYRELAPELKKFILRITEELSKEGYKNRESEA